MVQQGACKLHPAALSCAVMVTEMDPGRGYPVMAGEPAIRSTFLEELVTAERFEDPASVASVPRASVVGILCIVQRPPNCAVAKHLVSDRTVPNFSNSFQFIGCSR